jgi:hypothetical protein
LRPTSGGVISFLRRTDGGGPLPQIPSFVARYFALPLLLKAHPLSACCGRSPLPPLPSAHAFGNIHREGHRFPNREDMTGNTIRRHTMGDKGGKKDKDKGQKQKATKQAKDLKEKKDKQPKSALK